MTSASSDVLCKYKGYKGVVKCYKMRPVAKHDTCMITHRHCNTASLLNAIYNKYGNTKNVCRYWNFLVKILPFLMYPLFSKRLSLCTP